MFGGSSAPVSGGMFGGSSAPVSGGMFGGVSIGGGLSNQTSNVQFGAVSPLALPGVGISPSGSSFALGAQAATTDTNSTVRRRVKLKPRL